MIYSAQYSLEKYTGVNSQINSTCEVKIYQNIENIEFWEAVVWVLSKLGGFAGGGPELGKVDHQPIIKTHIEV